MTEHVTEHVTGHVTEYVTGHVPEPVNKLSRRTFVAKQFTSVCDYFVEVVQRSQFRPHHPHRRHLHHRRHRLPESNIWMIKKREPFEEELQKNCINLYTKIWNSLLK